MAPVIRVQNVGKKYRVVQGDAKGSYRTFRELVGDVVTAPFRRLRNPVEGGAAAEEFWALKDVSFDVHPGEVVGLIGRNGAGKSTLLKVLSRITKPTNGRVEVTGRVGSLLEVGTGFHPELTGRENVYLNGSILGMSRKEIDRRFDEIVAFSEVEKFLDTPVKRYSSGMYVRLAFAVAAHLQPEILIVDEVLAVGDATFQKKCLGRIREVSQGGRTVLFVSHDINAITRLCSRTVLLEAGAVKMDGPAWKVANYYTQSVRNASTAKRWADPGTAPGGAVARLRGVRFRTPDGADLEAVDTDTRFGVEMGYEVLTPGLHLVPNFHFFTGSGLYLFVSIDRDPAWAGRVRPPGRYVSTAWVPPHLLAEGELRVSVALTRMDPQTIYFHEQEVLTIFVTDRPDGLARSGYDGALPGVVRPLLDWSTEHAPGGGAA